MKNYFDVAGKYAVVTGASSGLGRQFALCLAEQGCNVAIAARRVERLEEVKKEVEAYGVKCLVLPCDVTDTEQIRNSVDKVVKEFGRIDILINNAAASFASRFSIAISSMSADRSTPIMSYPASAKISVRLPVPHPRLLALIKEEPRLFLPTAPHASSGKTRLIF